MPTAVGSSSGSVAYMLLCAVNGIEPAFASRRPQFISWREVRGRIVEGADSNLDLVGSVDKRKDGRTARRAKVTVVGGLPPASGLSGHRYFVRRPHSKKIANRAGLFSTQQTVAKTDSERLPADLKPHLTAVAATRSLSHVSLPLWIVIAGRRGRDERCSYLRNSGLAQVIDEPLAACEINRVITLGRETESLKREPWVESQARIDRGSGLVRPRELGERRRQIKMTGG